MLDAVLNAVVSVLTDAGLTALRQFPDAALDPAAGPVICVGLKKTELLSAGNGDYLGQRAQGGVVSEVYGVRMDCVLALDVYSPVDMGAAGCAASFGALSSALGALPSGLRRRALICGETDFDERTGMFLARCELHALALLTREENAETGVFTDFTLRGVMA